MIMDELRAKRAANFEARKCTKLCEIMISTLACYKLSSIELEMYIPTYMDELRAKRAANFEARKCTKLCEIMICTQSVLQISCIEP